jgi:hypothetical protein
MGLPDFLPSRRRQPAAEVVRLALVNGLARDDKECPSCQGTVAEPDLDQLLDVVNLPDDELWDLSRPGRGLGCSLVPSGVKAAFAWCPGCQRLVAAGEFPQAWWDCLWRRPTPSREAPHGLLRHLAHHALLDVVTGARNCRRAPAWWLDRQGHPDQRAHFQTEVDDQTWYWRNFAHDTDLLAPVFMVAVKLGWLPQGFSDAAYAALVEELGGVAEWPAVASSPVEGAGPGPDDGEGTGGGDFTPLFGCE